MKSREISIRTCKKKIPCVDCENTGCWFQGRKESNCPKYKCDREGKDFLDCDHCDFIDEWIERMRKDGH